ncbi:MAG: acyltransferase [Gemmatimonadaceae bacterium]|nr:acyltransferase [Gemmatimonadaceae bacterium]
MYVSPFASIRNHRWIRLGPGCRVDHSVTLWCTFLKVGKFVDFNPGVAAYGRVEIGDFVLIAPNVMIAGGNHGTARIETPMYLQRDSSRGIVIEDDVWIGANAVILDGVRFGRDAIARVGLLRAPWARMRRAQVRRDYRRRRDGHAESPRSEGSFTTSGRYPLPCAHDLRVGATVRSCAGELF